MRAPSATYADEDTTAHDAPGSVRISQVSPSWLHSQLPAAQLRSLLWDLRPLRAKGANRSPRHLVHSKCLLVFCIVSSDYHSTWAKSCQQTKREPKTAKDQQQENAWAIQQIRPDLSKSVSTWSVWYPGYQNLPGSSDHCAPRLRCLHTKSATCRPALSIFLEPFVSKLAGCHRCLEKRRHRPPKLPQQALRQHTRSQHHPPVRLLPKEQFRWENKRKKKRKIRRKWRGIENHRSRQQHHCEKKTANESSEAFDRMQSSHKRKCRKWTKAQETFLCHQPLQATHHPRLRPPSPSETVADEVVWRVWTLRLANEAEGSHK